MNEQAKDKKRRPNVISLKDPSSFDQYICQTYPPPHEHQWAILSHQKTGDCCLHVAAHCGNVHVLRRTIHAANIIGLSTSSMVERCNFDGKHPLHEAAHFSQLQAVRCLIEEFNALPDPLKRADWTPLMLACTREHLDIVQCLVEAGAQLHLRNKDGWTPLHIACREGHSPIVEYLLEKDSSSVPICGRNGRSPVHTAAAHGHLVVVQMLCAKFPGVLHLQDNGGIFPWIEALRNGEVEVARWMLQSAQPQLDIHAVDALGREAVHLVAEAGQLSSLQYLLELDPQVIHRPTRPAGLTPLHYACKECHSQLVALLLSLGCQGNVCDEKGRNAAFFAVSGQSESCLKILLNSMTLSQDERQALAQMSRSSTMTQLLLLNSTYHR